MMKFMTVLDAAEFGNCGLVHINDDMDRQPGGRCYLIDGELLSVK